MNKKLQPSQNIVNNRLVVVVVQESDSFLSAICSGNVTRNGKFWIHGYFLFANHIPRMVVYESAVKQCKANEKLRQVPQGME